MRLTATPLAMCLLLGGGPALAAQTLNAAGGNVAGDGVRVFVGENTQL
jgi:hypothetical protein